jgi:hypothetical protein
MNELNESVSIFIIKIVLYNVVSFQRTLKKYNFFQNNLLFVDNSFLNIF